MYLREEKGKISIEWDQDALLEAYIGRHWILTELGGSNDMSKYTPQIPTF